MPGQLCLFPDLHIGDDETCHALSIYLLTTINLLYMEHLQRMELLPTLFLQIAQGNLPSSITLPPPLTTMTLFLVFFLVSLSSHQPVPSLQHKAVLLDILTKFF